MIPAKQEGRSVLRCTKCGHVEEVSIEAVREYRLVERSPVEERTITTSVVSKAKWRPPKTTEEWEQEREEYREILQELLQEELEGLEE